MKYTDESIAKGITFKDLEYGDGFEDIFSLYIKTDSDHGFDVINNEYIMFNLSSMVTPRDCEIIFH